MKILRLGAGIGIFALISLPLPVAAGEATKQLSATIDGFVPIIRDTPRE